jgi:hypothetical protein
VWKGVRHRVTALSWRAMIDGDEERVLSHTTKLIITVAVFALGVLAGAAIAAWIVPPSRSSEPDATRRGEERLRRADPKCLAQPITMFDMQQLLRNAATVSGPTPSQMILPVLNGRLLRVG